MVAVCDEADVRFLMRRIGADEKGIQIMAPKGVFRVIHVRGLSAPALIILKQEMLAKGAEAAIGRGAIVGEAGSGEALLMGTVQQLRQAVEKLKQQPFGLRQLAEQLEKIPGIAARNESEGSGKGEDVSPPLRILDCRGRKLPLGQRTLVMGILNVTPDSFSDGGKFLAVEEAVARARQIEAEGADILDVGGESTRPGANPVTVEEEWQRLAPVLERLPAEVSIPISVDTYKSEVARRALELGVHMINDVWGLKADPAMAETVAASGAAVVLMHNRREPHYEGDLLQEIACDLEASLRLAEKAGIDEKRIVLDPGIGFGKTTEHNLEVLRRLRELTMLDKPLLLGTSRKRFIGQVLDLPMEERLEGTAATVVLGITAGVDIIRVHDVQPMVRVARMTDAVLRRRQ